MLHQVVAAKKPAPALVAGTLFIQIGLLENPLSRSEGNFSDIHEAFLNTRDGSLTITEGGKR
jgi:hypothetical protein